MVRQDSGSIRLYRFRQALFTMRSAIWVRDTFSLCDKRPISHFSFLLDGDGTLDVLLAVRDAGGMDTILVGHNIQMPLCVHPWDTDCRHATHLCVSDPGYLRDLSFVTPTAHVSTVRLGSASHNITAIFDGDAYLVLSAGRQHFHIKRDEPFGLHVGDYNHDGFPDLLLPLHTEGHIELWENTRCEDASCPGTWRTYLIVIVELISDRNELDT